jgi:hypothetical protein
MASGAALNFDLPPFLSQPKRVCAETNHLTLVAGRTGLFCSWSILANKVRAPPP